MNPHSSKSGAMSSPSRPLTNPDAAIKYRTIPHGLTYKHETRHKRPQSTSPARRHTVAVASSPAKRQPLSSVTRPPPPPQQQQQQQQKQKQLSKSQQKKETYKKLDIVGAKQDLSMLLQTADTDENGQKIAPAAGTASEDNTGRVYKLLPDTDGDDGAIESSPVHSYQNRKRVAGSGSPVQKKRVRSGIALANVVVAANAIGGSGTGYETPVQEEAKSSTPKRAHHQRVVEGAVDLQNSPLANVSSGSIVDQKIDGETEVIRQLNKTKTAGISELKEGEDKDDDKDDDRDEDVNSSDEAFEDAKISPIRLTKAVLLPLERLDAKKAEIEKAEIEKLEQADAEQAEAEQSVADGDVSLHAIFTSAQLQEVKDNLEKTVTALKEEVSTKADRIESLLQASADFDQQQNELLAEVDQLKSEKVELENKVSALEVEASSATEFATDADKKYSVAGLKLRIAESKLDKYEQLYGEVMEAARALEQRLESEKEQKLAVEQHVEELQRAQATLQRKCDELESSLEVTKAEVDSLVEEKASNAALVDALKDQVEESAKENEKLSVELKLVQDENGSLKQRDLQAPELRKKVEAKEEQLVHAKEETERLKEKIGILEGELAGANKKVDENDKTTEMQLEKLAQDLYLQYSAKHEQKVATLRKGYEMKWMGKVKKFTKDNEELKREITSLKKKLEVETNEKNQLVKLWDEYVSIEKKK